MLLKIMCVCLTANHTRKRPCPCGARRVTPTFASGSKEDDVDVFAHYLRFKTVSSENTDDHVLQPEEFKAGHRFLKESFPLVHSKLEYEKVRSTLATIKINQKYKLGD